MKKSFRVLLIAILAFMMLGMSSCVVEFIPGEHEYDYKVWAKTYDDYRVFEYEFGVNTRYSDCIYGELSDREWRNLVYENENGNEYNDRHYWNVYEIEDWLYDKDIISRRDSADMADWLVSVKHGYVALRYGWNVYVVLK